MWYVWMLVASSACAMPAQPDLLAALPPHANAVTSESDMSDKLIAYKTPDTKVISTSEKSLALKNKATSKDAQTSSEKSPASTHVVEGSPVASYIARSDKGDVSSGKSHMGVNLEKPPEKSNSSSPIEFRTLSSGNETPQPGVPGSTDFVSHGIPKIAHAEREGRQATPRPAAGMLDRAASELQWRRWLQSPESGSPNAPPRRLIAKSLFIPPINCPKGQQLERGNCIELLSLDKMEPARNLLEHLQGLVPPDVEYDYGEAEADGPLQLTLPLGLEPAVPLAAPPPAPPSPPPNTVHAVGNKKDEKPIASERLEAELERLKLGHKHNHLIEKQQSLQSHAEKPKRDSHLSAETMTTVDTSEKYETSTDAGEKEVIYGHVNVDPILPQNDDSSNYYVEATTTESTKSTTERERSTDVTATDYTITDVTTTDLTDTPSTTEVDYTTENTDRVHELIRTQNTQLSPVTENIGDTIKLISRYADVTTDDTYAKKESIRDTNNYVLGTRERLQHNRVKPKKPAANRLAEPLYKVQESADRKAPFSFYPNKEPYYFRYPWRSEYAAVPTPPAGYPFRHVQDYWRGRRRSGLYSQNPRRHHHAAAARYSAERGRDLLGLLHWLSAGSDKR